ncbi:efflux RND transporter periplasmic adaptor subunit [Tolypothrix sp. FACHB-123]|uniref:efflux RND transporter periplasmic adaptor subunit n=1 Tax=Tolypothrix sp. FACHB-123 TaxID=2692868 RepID=UPI0016881885|nr:efflux RND transporter periplasmic adaptor subunit [Tolypothrix sp. FACHB-123]MBD2353140.1 efflux RND transporter periplasmic adaptor subunit [Tolypothrix sp. FACHB-123]
MKISMPFRRLNRSQLGLLGLLLLVGGGIVVWRTVTPSTQPPSAPMAQGFPPTTVETISLKRGEGLRRIQLLGQVEASKSATLRTQTAGTVERVFVEVGDRVTPGMTIATLDDADQQLVLAEAKAKLAQARSELARLEVGTRPEIIAQREAELRSMQAREREAQQNLKRYQELVTAGAISEKALLEERAAVDATRAERLKVQAALAEAKAGPTQEEIAAQQASVAAAVSAVNQAQLTLARTQVKASVAGIVRSREVSVGDLVESRDPVFTLVNSNELDVFLELPEQLSGSITPGLPVQLTARAIPNWQRRATISGVVPAANAASRRQMVRVRLQNPPQNLLPKMAIAAELQLQVDPNSFVVPRDALVRRDENWLVYTVANGKATQVEVKLVVDMGETMAISSDQLQVGQPVVVRGGEALMPGAPVQIAEQNTRPDS